jgi:hypothetical protein
MERDEAAPEVDQPAWFLLITCGVTEGVDDPRTIWYGRLANSPTPNGVYTRVGGYDTRATVEIETAPV